VFPARATTAAKTSSLPTEAFSNSSICYYKLINRSAAGLSDHRFKSLSSFEVDVPLSYKAQEADRLIDFIELISNLSFFPLL
jgi:hypothetical protein